MMLKKFYSDPRRIDIEFHNGINIVCADKTEKSKDTDTRNGTGKSTLLHLIDYCFMAKPMEKIIESEEFQKFTFTIEFVDNKNNLYKIRRSIKEPEKILIAVNSDDFEEKTIEDTIGLLRKIMFGLPEKEKDPLTFRTLMNAVMRDEEDGFSKKTFYQYCYWPKYMSDAVNLHLIGLDYRNPIEKDKLIKKKNEFGKIIFGLTKELEKKGLEKKAALKSQKVIIDNDIQKRKKQIDEFKVHSEYEKIQFEANRLTRNLNELQNHIFVIRETVGEYEESLSEEIEFNIDDLESLYKSLEIHFKDELKKEFSDITNFHKRLIENRNNYLAEEIKKLKEAEQKLNEKSIDFDEKRSQLFQILQTHGALSEYNKILERLDGLKKGSNQLGHYIEMHDEIAEYNKEKQEATNNIATNNSKSEEIISKSEEIISKIVLIFEEIFQSLVNVSGILSIGIKDKYKVDDHIFEFSIKSERDGCPGIGRTKIFSYDMALLFYNIEIGREYPYFIIHDGIFNGVDPRTVINAFNYLDKKSEDTSFQYIIAINTDLLPDKYNDPKYEIKKIPDIDSLMGFSF